MISDERWRADHDRHQRARDAEQQADLDRDRATRDARWKALPVEFRGRFDRFVGAKGDLWRRDYEPYELFCCEQAHAIATALHANGMGVAEFHRIASFADQRRIVPALSEDHSGNSFGMACRLAALFLTSRDDVAREHGALVPLVGCEDYGCTHEPRRTDARD